jgi:predicted NBD/HSP70 family sugar kinase
VFKSGSTRLVKNLNQQHVLNLVRMKRGISAREIGQTTQLQMSTISYTLRELKEAGFIRETGMGESSFLGGKPPVLWELSPEYGFVIGLELMPKEIRLVLLDFSLNKLVEKSLPVHLESGVEKIAGTVREVVTQTLEQQQISETTVLGLGIGFPGIIDAAKGFVHYSYAFNLKNAALREALVQYFSFPVNVANDANAGALGIKWLTHSEQMVPHILYATINQNFQGMGIGLIINHELYEGAQGFAGEILSTMSLAKRKRMVHQATEKFGNSSGLLRRLAVLEPGIIPVRDVVAEIENGDEAAKYILRQIAKEIGNELTRLVDLFDPATVVIGGDICIAEPYITRIIQERVSGMGASREITVQFSPFGIYSVAMGSTALIFQQIFRPR